MHRWPSTTFACLALACNGGGDPPPDDTGAAPTGTTDTVDTSTPGVDPNRVARAITSATGPLADVVAGNTRFAFDVYGELVDGTDGNVFLSPFSMSAALGMTLAGADDVTRTEMQTVLGVTGDEAAWHTALGALIRDLDGDFARGYTLQIANRLWGQTGYPWEDDFLDVCADDYDAPLADWDFRTDPEGGREAVNDWVEAQTNDRIEDLLPPGSVTDATRMILANAIYFLADWATPFDPDDTTDRPFTRLDGSTVQAPTMAIDTEAFEEHGLGLGSVDGAQVVRLPYQDDEVSMILVVPNDPGGLPALEAQLDADTFGAWVDAVSGPATFQLLLPKLTMRFETNLVPALVDLGLTTAFQSETAHFDRMAAVPEDGRLFISGVFHQAFVDVDEQGTEAAAATGVVVGTDSAPPVVEATHPFLFALYDELTGSVLFLGRVMDPTAG